MTQFQGGRLYSSPLPAGPVGRPPTAVTDDPLMKGGLVKRSFWVAGPVVGCLLLAMFASLATASNRLPTTTTISCPHSVTYSGLPQAPCTASVTGTGLNQTLTVRYSRDNTDAGVVFATAR